MQDLVDPQQHAPLAKLIIPPSPVRLLWVRLEGTANSQRQMRLVGILKACVKDKKVGVWERAEPACRDE